MHDHIMDTSEVPKPVLREGVNGSHVITTTLESTVPNSKIVNVTQASPHAPSNILNHVIPVPPASLPSISPSVRPLTFSPQSPVTHIQVPRSTQIPVPNNVFPRMEFAAQKPTLVLTQNSIIPNENHIVNHVSTPQNYPPHHLTPISAAQQPILSQANVTQNHVPNPSQGPAFGQHPQPLSVITSVIGTSVIQTFTNSVQTPTTSGSVSLLHQRQQQQQQHQQAFPMVRAPVTVENNSALRLQPNAVITLTSNIEQISEVPQNASKKEESEEGHSVHGAQDDSSDTDMEIKSLDLTSRVNIIDPKAEKERERPMSWEGELSDSEIEKNGTQEEQMRVEAPDEPMSPMSPVSPCSDNDQDPLPTQIKSEDALDAHSAFTAQTLPQTDSPVPARSDSGCELHVGPFTPTQSPLLPRIHPHTHSPTHLYSPTQSPSQSRHLSGFSSPYSHSPSTGLSRNNSDASQYGGSYNSYSSAPSPISPLHYSPSQSPNLGRVIGSFPGGGSGHGALFGGPLDLREPHGHGNVQEVSKEIKEDERLTADLAQHSVLAAQSGITRQQLINSPCPICGDKISGFHYGIFSCESCKGFFKRTVQNKKHYVCMRGSSCPVTIATRKKCPACRFDRCLRKGMKLEAIREDRTRGGRSTYQCAPYTLPPSLVSPSSSGVSLDQARISDGTSVKSEPQEGEDVKPSSSREKPAVPLLLQQICDVEHLWHCSEAEMSQIRQADAMAREMMESESGDCVSMCKIAEGRLYKIVKWCKSLPLFRHISIDDQIILLMNSWCELLLLSCCFRSMDSPGEIRVSSGRTMSLSQAESMGIGPCIERMLNLSYQLRRLQVDSYEYMAMKVIVLLTSDVAGLKEGEKVRYSQEKVVQALQEYTLSKYPHLPSKFGELLLRIPELQRTCHASKEMLSVKKKEGDVPSFNFLFELLRGDH